MLHTLVGQSHPLIAFLVARSIPALIRDQGPDGLWPEGEMGSFEIVRILKRLDFLDSLVPA